MNKLDFIKTIKESGYGSEKNAKEYVRLHPKENYNTNDIVDMYHTYTSLNIAGGDTKGLRHVYGINGKTTAMSNGIRGNSSGNQDWN